MAHPHSLRWLARPQKCGAGEIPLPNEEGRSGQSPGRSDQNGVGDKAKDDNWRASQLDDGKSDRA